MDALRHMVQEIVKEAMGPSNKTIVCVDIQPEYASYFGFDVRSWTKFLNSSVNNNNVVLLYNGPDLGMTSEREYIDWLFQNGLKEKSLNHIRLFDKGYAFFRYCMDSNIDEDAIVDLVKFMITRNVNDSRDIDVEMWDEFMQQHSHEDVRELLDGAEDLISIPDLMQYLSPLNNIVLTGGGIHECLKEVEIALKVLGKNYSIMDKFTY